MSSATRPPPSAARRRRRSTPVRMIAKWLRRLLALAALLAVGGAIYYTTTRTLHKGTTHSKTATLPAPKTLRRAPRSDTIALHFRVSKLVLPVAVQDATGASAAQRAIMVGGTDAASNAVASAFRFDSNGLFPETLTSPAHDAGVAILGSDTYLFGGDTPSLSASIEQLMPGGATQQVGELPSATSDASVAVIANTAYIVGGYDGNVPLTTILSWRPGTAPQDVANLPVGLRDPAVAAVANRVLIVGGETASGVSRAVYVYSVKTGRVSGVLQLPHPLEDATAVAVRGRVYIFGGRSSASGPPRSTILVYDPEHDTMRVAGRLPTAVSGATALAYSGRLVVAGGEGGNGVPSTVVYVMSLARR